MNSDKNRTSCCAGMFLGWIKSGALQLLNLRIKFKENIGYNYG